MNNSNKNLAIVDDDASIRRALSSLLRCEGWSVSAYASAEDFPLASSPRGIDCLILDITLPGMTGLELQRRLKLSEWRHVPIIFHTGCCEERVHTQAIRGGAFAFLSKPVAPETLLWAVRYAIQLAR